MEDFRSGFIAITGRPNVGKSTLLNRLTGEKLAIVSSKPQTTRNQIRGVLTRDGFQAVFIDTPGIHEPKTKLGGLMVKSAEAALGEVDIVIYMTEADLKNFDADAGIITRIARASATLFLVLNKADKVPKPDVLTVIDRYGALHSFAEIVPVSALTGENADELLAAIKNHLPTGPRYFPDDYLTDRPERFVAAEIIREKILLYLQDEIPHGTAVEITSFKQKKNMIEIGATIVCEKESHKGIIIGKQGGLLKKIGGSARTEIENLLGARVFLETWVKVKKNWRDDDFTLRTLGYGKNG